MTNISEFVPGVCCEHNWTGPSHRQQCDTCGATCSRDEQGKIVTYSAGDSTEVRKEKRA